MSTHATRPLTVIGIYADDQQRFAETFDATDYQDAERQAHAFTGQAKLIIAGVVEDAVMEDQL